MHYLTLIALLIPMMASAVNSKETEFPRRKLSPGVSISVFRYIADADVYELSLTESLDVGPNFARSEDLKAGLGDEGSLAQFRRRLQRDKDAEYTLQKELPMLEPPEIEARAKALRAKASKR